MVLCLGNYFQLSGGKPHNQKTHPKPHQPHNHDLSLGYYKRKNWTSVYKETKISLEIPTAAFFFNLLKAREKSY